MITTEFRLKIEGHKYGKDFVSWTTCFDRERQLKHFADRIANPPSASWKPTITKVTIFEREVTEWREATK